MEVEIAVLNAQEKLSELSPNETLRLPKSDLKLILDKVKRLEALVAALLASKINGDRYIDIQD